MSPVNGGVAPVCPVSRSQVPAGMPGIIVPFVPRAVDLPSAIAAANQASRLAQIYLAPPKPSNGLPSGSTAGIGGTKKRTSDRWKEKKRTTNTIRFYVRDEKGNEDKEQWVEVERIVYIKWHDRVQNIDLIFQWPYDPVSEGGKLMNTKTVGADT